MKHQVSVLKTRSGYFGLSNRADVTSYNQLGFATYLFVRAHDSEVQTVIADITYQLRIKRYISLRLLPISLANLQQRDLKGKKQAYNDNSGEGSSKKKKDQDNKPKKGKDKGKGKAKDNDTFFKNL